MEFLGLDIRRTEPTVLGLSPSADTKTAADMITHLPQRVGGGWWATVRESFAGAWQRNITVDKTEAMTYGTVWACVTLIAADIAKLWIKVVQEDAASGINVEVHEDRFGPLLKRPNHYQLRPKFIEYWLISKLTSGNTYVLKERDAAGVVRALYVLDPTRVTVLVAPDGSVFYQLAADYLSGLQESISVPASEIIHDVCVPLYHPLCGVAPIHACGLAAMQGLKIQQSSAKLFANGSNPGGVLTAPAAISEATATRLQQHWDANYAGEANIGKVVVLGDGLKFEPMVMSAVNAQLIEQLKWTSENICSCYHVPGFMVGIGAAPPYTDVQSLNLQYYSQALQNLIENIEALLEHGLEAPAGIGIEFDLDALLRMDSKTIMEIAKVGVVSGLLKPDEGRASLNYGPVPGGDTPYMQQQMYSLKALAARDARAPAPATPELPPALPPAPTKTAAIEPHADEGEARVTLVESVRRELAA